MIKENFKMAYKAVYNGDSLYHFNPNHDKKNGRFTFKKIGDRITNFISPAPSKKQIEEAAKTLREKEQKEAEENKKDISEIVKRIKKEKLLETEGMQAYKDFKSKTGNYKKLKASAVTGLKALAKTAQRDVMDDEYDDEGSAFWFLFEDQTFGMPQIADLANRGKTKEQIAKIISDCNEIGKQDPYSDMPGVWSLFEGYSEWRSGVYKDGSLNSNTEEFIDACIEAAKESKQVSHSGTTEFGDYLCHYNKNHDPKTGRFAPSKDNKYQLKSGYLTPEGKQRWARQYMSDVKAAQKKGLNTSNIQTPIESEKWLRKDRAKKAGSAVWLGATFVTGGYWRGQRKITYNEESINEFLKTHSGDSVYKIK